MRRSNSLQQFKETITELKLITLLLHFYWNSEKKSEVLWWPFVNVLQSIRGQLKMSQSHQIMLFFWRVWHCRILLTPKQPWWLQWVKCLHYGMEIIPAFGCVWSAVRTTSSRASGVPKGESNSLISQNGAMSNNRSIYFWYRLISVVIDLCTTQTTCYSVF